MESQKLSVAELTITASGFDSKCSSPAIENIKGVVCAAFTCESKLSRHEIALLYNLSFAFVIFEVVEIDGDTYLLPIENLSPQYFDDKITTILKYQGKTNETFTKMMINVAAQTCSTTNDTNLRLLDPMAGKGTTLFCGLTRGFDVYGIEISTKYTNEIGIFFKKYLEREKYKHTTQKRTITSKQTKKQIGKASHFEFAHKQDFADGNTQKLEIVDGDSALTNFYYKKNYFDIIVVDLPYGIQHSSKQQRQSKGFTRNPEQLLSASLPAWRDVLKRGGVLVISYNTNVISKTKANDLLSKAGLTVLDEDIYNQFEHRVDASIKRDISIAKKEIL
jgi:16S rRNA G966 N2-methylase RsmD